MLGKIQYYLSKSSSIVYLMLKLKNQIQIIIGNHITAESNFTTNGERKVVDFLLKKCHIKTMVDVGANTGQYLGALLKITQENQLTPLTIHAFEPAKNTYLKLFENFKHQPNIQFYNLALSAEQGELTFFESEELGEMSSVIQRNNENYLRSYKVKVDTMDNLFINETILDFVKIDTEGNDFNVILGAIKLLKNKKIRYMQVEYGDNWRFAGHTFIYFNKYMENLGYKVYLIRPDGCYQLDYNKWKEYYSFSNFLVFLAEEEANIKDLLKGTF
jgi:FkbM family methyltransferase